MKAKPLQVCIVGGGFGGLYTAIYLSHFAWVKAGKCQITLIEPKEHFLFTPLLYELITGELQLWEIAPSYFQLLLNTNIQFCQEKVKNINFQLRQVALDNEERITYDFLVLAVGNQNYWANIPGLQNNALTFRTIEDVEQLQTKLHLLEASVQEMIHLTIIGGGPNGVELACKLADRLGKRGKIRLIERGDEILTNFSQGVRVAAYKALNKRKVQLDLQTNLVKIEAASITIARDGNIEQLPSDLSIWVAGTQAREWVRHLNCQQTIQGKLKVHPTLQLLDYPEVLALGDIAEIYPLKTNIPATAQAAYQQASCAAKNLLALMQGKCLKSFSYLHLGDMLTLGRRAAIVSSFCFNIEGRLADIIRRLAYIFRLPTFRHRRKVLSRLLRKVIGKVIRLFSWQLKHLFSDKSVNSYKRDI